MRALFPKEWMTLPRRAWSVSIGIARRYPWSCLPLLKRSVIGGFFWRMAAAMDEHGAFETHHLGVVLVNTPRPDCDDPLGWSALGLTLMQHRALGIERVAGEHRMAGLHLVPAEVGDDLGADRAHAHAGEQRKREGRVDQHLLPLGFGGVRRIKMDLLDVEGQQREVSVVDVEDGAAGAMLEHVAGLEVLKIEAGGFTVAAFADGLVSGQD